MATPKNIEELLERLNKQTPFKVPEGYFEEMENAVMHRIKQKGNELDKNVPFEVPEGYFDNFADKVMDKVEEKPVKVVNMWRQVASYAAAIAILAVSVFGIYYSKLPQKKTKADITFEDLTTEELMAAIENDVDLYLIEEVMNEETAAKESMDEEAKGQDTTDTEGDIDEAVESISDDELEEYLLNNIDDLLLDEI